VAVLLATAIVAGLGLCEALTRLFLPAFDPSGRFAFDHSVGSQMLGRPGTVARQAKNTGDYDVPVRINMHGLRDENDISTATPDEIIVVGDSFAWGWGVEARDRFSDRLQNLTGRRTFNLSTPTDIEGYADLLAYARSLGARANRVVIAVCMENDLHPYAARSDGRTVTPDTLPVRHWLSTHSAFYLFALTVVHQTPWLRTLAVATGLITPNLDGIARNEDDPRIIETSADRLLDIARHDRVLVVLIPSRALWAGPSRHLEDRVHRAFVAALQQRGIDMLDLRPLLEAKGKPLAYHFANDGHWNAAGHALAAEAISRHLAR
jgi:hypothetical protein